MGLPEILRSQRQHHSAEATRCSALTSHRRAGFSVHTTGWRDGGDGGGTKVSECVHRVQDACAQLCEEAYTHMGPTASPHMPRMRLHTSRQRPHPSLSHTDTRTLHTAACSIMFLEVELYSYQNRHARSSDSLPLSLCAHLSLESRMVPRRSSAACHAVSN